MTRRRASTETAEILFFGGRLLDAARAAGFSAGGARPTARPARPASRGARSEALWVRDGRIEAVGSEATLRRRLGKGAREVDLKGGTLMPGFTDAHIHLLTWRRALDEPWIDAQSPEAIERAVRARQAAAAPDDWILVRGWIPREWEPARRSRALLDRIAPERPLVLEAVDGHAVWANGAALARAGIDDRSPHPAGGIIERDRGGTLTGVLAETACKPLRAAMVHVEAPAATLRRALARARGLGITSGHDFDPSATWRAAQDLERQRSLGFRLLLSIPLATMREAIALGLRSGFGTERLRIGPVKMFADGTLGSATALLETPYEGRPDAGIEVTSRAELEEACTKAANSGLAVAIHAIGDRAVRHALDAIEAPLRLGRRYPLPPRVEHVQLARPEEFGRFRASGTIASVQPIHQVTDRAIARRLWGPRTERAYAWRTLLRAGARLIFGSDAPFDRASPLRALQAALTRRAPGEAETEVFHSGQRLTLGQALRAHLEEPHRAAGWETPLGRLAPGFGADLVHFDHDLFGIPVDSWHQVGVAGVWVGGRSEPIEKS